VGFSQWHLATQWLHLAHNRGSRRLAVYEAQEIAIPATAGLQNGVWFRIRQGVRGLIAEAGGIQAAYMIVEPSSYYYRIMTRSERMPVLIGERI
jgi:hypothetical protein